MHTVKQGRKGERKERVSLDEKNVKKECYSIGVTFTSFIQEKRPLLR